MEYVYKISKVSVQLFSSYIAFSRKGAEKFTAGSSIHLFFVFVFCFCHECYISNNPLSYMHPYKISEGSDNAFLPPLQ